MNSKIDINNRYPSDGELRKDMRPYEEYYKCLISTFNMSEIKSVCDVGCATGHLLYYLKKNHNIKIKGYEYFDYHKTSDLCKIKDDIEIYDIRDEMQANVVKYDIVNCSEVGEHIDKEYADILIENSKKLSKKYIIFTWSSHGGDLEPHCDPLHQHLNPLSREDYINLMKSHGLKANMHLTNKFLNESKKYRNFYFWWRESFVIWEKNL
jgi:2-polyprenyl-3-methyl-5-hydroxy-6-metoxy-1,4-benzoquinol methylase